MLSDIFSPLPPFFHFSVDIKIPLFSYVFWRLPLFFTVLSVLMWLTLSDMIWPSTFFLIFFIQLSQGQVLRCILTLSPNFYIVCLVIKIQFLQTNFGASSYSFHFFCLYGFDVLGQNLTVSLFSSFLIQLSQGQCSPTYFDPSPSFLIFLSSGQSSIFCDMFWGFPLLFFHFWSVLMGPSPTFFHFWSVLMELMLSDIIWLSPFFFIMFYPIFTRSIFSDIFWPFPLFFNIFLSSCQS